MKGLLIALARRWKLKRFSKYVILVFVDDVVVLTDGESILEGCKLKELRK